MAQLYARGELGLDQEYVHASVLGTTFHRPPARHHGGGWVRRRGTHRAGRAWVTGLASYLLDPDDPFPAGFLLGRET